MNRTRLSLFLAFAIAFSSIGTVARGQPSDQAARVKADIASRLSKNEEHVKIKLRNGTELKGRIVQTSDTGFTLVADDSGSRSEIAYADVRDVEGRGVSKKKKGFLVAAIVVGAAITALAIALANFMDD